MILSVTKMGGESGLPQKLLSSRGSICKDLTLLFYLRSILKINQTAVPPTWFHLFRKQTELSTSLRLVLLPQSRHGNPSVMSPRAWVSQKQRWEARVPPPVRALCGEERCVEDTCPHLCQCLRSHGDFIGQVKTYWGQTCKQRLSLKLGRQVDSKQLYV